MAGISYSFEYTLVSINGIDTGLEIAILRNYLFSKVSKKCEEEVRNDPPLPELHTVDYVLNL